MVKSTKKRVSKNKKPEKARVFLCIIGKTGSGKETVYNLIREELGSKFKTAIHRFSDPINEVLGVLDLPSHRKNQQLMSTTLRQVFGESLLGNVIHGRAIRNEADVVFLDGIRRPHDVVKLKQLPEMKLLAVTAHPEVRFERLKKRADRPGDKEKTWEEFLQEQAAEPEMMIEEISKEAHFVLDNSGDLENLRRQVKIITADIGID